MFYYSKWRKEWVEFNKPPTKGQIMEMKKFNYKIKKDDSERL